MPIIRSRIFLIAIVILLPLGASGVSQLRLESEAEWVFDYEVSVFCARGRILVWDDRASMLRVIENSQAFPGSIRLPHGEGPGEFLMVKGICGDKDEYLVWDSRSRRITVFDRDWRLKSVHRIPLSQISSLHGRGKKGWLFRFAYFIGEGTTRRITSRVAWIKGASRRELWRTEGVWSRGKVYNNDRPHLLFAWSPPFMYFARNDRPSVIRRRVGSGSPSDLLEIKVQVESPPWTPRLEALKWRVVRRPSRPRSEAYPSRVPPLIGLAADGDRLVVISNGGMGKDRARVDLYIGGKHVGRGQISFLYAQYFVFPPTFFHSNGIHLVGDHLFTLHYDEGRDRFRLVRRRIIVED